MTKPNTTCCIWLPLLLVWSTQSSCNPLHSHSTSYLLPSPKRNKWVNTLVARPETKALLITLPSPKTFSSHLYLWASTNLNRAGLLQEEAMLVWQLLGCVIKLEMCQFPTQGEGGSTQEMSSIFLHFSRIFRSKQPIRSLLPENQIILVGCCYLGIWGWKCESISSKSTGSTIDSDCAAIWTGRKGNKHFFLQCLESQKWV